MLRGCRNTTSHQFFGYLRRTFSGHTHFKDVTYNGSSFFVYDPVVFILRILQISIRRICTQGLAGITLCPKYGFHLFAGVLGVEFVENVDERSHIVINLILAVHSIVDGNEADIVSRKYHLCVHAHLKVISPKAAHVLYNDDADFVFINQAVKPLPVRSVEVGATIAIVHEIHGVSKPLIVSELFEDRLLIHNEVALSLKIIVTGEPAVKSRYLVSCNRGRRSVQFCNCMHKILLSDRLQAVLHIRSLSQ